ncbi:MAG: ribonuclease HII [Candidatus Pacearchaeota archaeon]
MEYLIGVDDAGRGPVIGPMIVAGLLIKKEDESFLKKIKVKDSKLLSPTIRNKLKEELTKKFSFFYQIISPEEIDSSSNLNTLEAQYFAVIINKLSLNLKGKIEVFVDCPSVNINKWKKLLSSMLLRKDLKLVVEHKADFKYLVVSGASIIAKEKREEEIKKLKKELNLDFGSGYPSDPKTISFLKENFKDEKIKKIIRKKWESFKRLEKKEQQKKLF